MSFQHFPSLPGEPSGVNFLSEESDFELSEKEEIEKWLNKIIEQEEKELRLLNFVFCTDEYLHRLNVKYLDHDTLTDVITFQYAETPYIEGDIYISIDRIRENAQEYGVSFFQELCRVMVHGVLHLCGYDDKTPEDASLMRQKENDSLLLLSN